MINDERLMRAYSLSLSGEGLEFWGERSIFAVGLEKGGRIRLFGISERLLLMVNHIF